MSGWRCWLAFEVRPGITRRAPQDGVVRSRALFESCRLPDGRIDPTEFARWTDVLVEYGYQWGQA